MDIEQQMNNILPPAQNCHFSIDDYDCIGFDMDHTIVQYNVPETFKVGMIGDWSDIPS